MAIVKEFGCARCGQCCAHQDAIQLTSCELIGLAEYLRVAPSELFTRHCTIAGTGQNPARHIYIRTTEGRCPFLDGSLCSVHEARPFACRAYPMRTLQASAGDMKGFVRQKYPMLESTCSLFRLGDDDVLAGDLKLLVDQAIAFAVDEIYLNAITAETVDLAVPAQATADFLVDGEARAEAEAFLRSAGGKPMSQTISRMALALQARAWGDSLFQVRAPSRITLNHAERPGNYVLVATDHESVEAVRELVSHPRLCCKAFSMPAAAGKMLVSAVYAPPEGGQAVGFQLELEAASVKEITCDATMPVYVFFVDEADPDPGQAVGLTLNVEEL